MTILGVDPGITGGLAIISDTEGVWLEPMPLNADGQVDPRELSRLLSTADMSDPIKVAYVEAIFALPKNGAHTMMVFGKSYGIVIGVLTMLGIPIVEVRSQRWMKEIYHGCPADREKKDRSKWAFKRIFQGVSATAPGRTALHLGMLEAALIAEYGRRVEEGLCSQTIS